MRDFQCGPVVMIYEMETVVILTLFNFECKTIKKFHNHTLGKTKRALLTYFGILYINTSTSITKSNFRTLNHTFLNKIQFWNESCFHSQLKRLVVFRCPAVVFRFGCELPFLFCQLWADQVNLSEWSKHTWRLPFHVIHSNHWRERDSFTSKQK